MIYIPIRMICAISTDDSYTNTGDMCNFNGWFLLFIRTINARMICISIRMICMNYADDLKYLYGWLLTIDARMICISIRMICALRTDDLYTNTDDMCNFYGWFLLFIRTIDARMICIPIRMICVNYTDDWTICIRMIIDDVHTDEFYFNTDDMCELYGRLKIFIRMIIDDFRTDDLYFHTDDMCEIYGRFKIFIRMIINNRPYKLYKSSVRKSSV